MLLLSAAAAAADRAALVESLRDGGYVVYFRHAQTDWADPDRLASEADLASCDRNRMRQLSARGRATARAVGQAMARLAIPVAAVFASPYCRAVETAELLGLQPVQITRDILNLRAAHYAGGREAVERTARTRLSTPPARRAERRAGRSRQRVPAGGRPPEAGAALVRPTGDGDFEVIGVLSAEDWIEVAAMVSGGG